MMMDCCSNLICYGCAFAKLLRRTISGSKMPVLLAPKATSQKEADKNLMKRIDVNDPIALCQKGKQCRREGDYSGAFEYWTKAALGDIRAHYSLSICTRTGMVLKRTRRRKFIFR